MSSDGIDSTGIMVIEPRDADRRVEGGISIFKNQRQSLQRELLEFRKNEIVGDPAAIEWHAANTLSLQNRLERRTLVPYRKFKSDSIRMIRRLMRLAEQRELLEYHCDEILASTRDEKSNKARHYSAKEIRKVVFANPGTAQKDRDNSLRVARMFLQNLSDDFYFEQSELDAIETINSDLPGWASLDPKGQWNPEDFAKILKRVLDTMLDLGKRKLERKPGRRVELEKYTLALGDLYRNSVEQRLQGKLSVLRCHKVYGDRATSVSCERHSQ